MHWAQLPPTPARKQLLPCHTFLYPSRTPAFMFRWATTTTCGQKSVPRLRNLPVTQRGALRTAKHPDNLPHRSAVHKGLDNFYLLLMWFHVHQSPTLSATV